MKYAVCVVAVAPVRNEPGHKEEMISQLLFGECCIITETDKSGFAKIKIKADGYTGWCMVAQLIEIAEGLYLQTEKLLAGEWTNTLEYNSGKMQIPYGSTLTGLYGGKILLGKDEFSFKSIAINTTTLKRDTETIKNIASIFLNTPYLWGGRSVFGIDCSGFTQLVFKFLNFHLLRDAQLQATQGELVNFLQEAKCGDLAFFDNADGNIIHTGILLNNHEIIHASGKVQIDKIDNSGIINAQTGIRTHQLRIIKRYF